MHVKDQDGNIYKITLVAGASLPEGFEEIEIPEELQSEDLIYLEEVDGVVQKRSTADRDRRNEILDQLRELRKPLLDEADIEINKIIDAVGDHSAWSTYRQALRDIPAGYIKVDGDPKVAVDTIDLENFNWPQKPE